LSANSTPACDADAVQVRYDTRPLEISLMRNKKLTALPVIELEFPERCKVE
jgi:hypothetical protein